MARWIFTHRWVANIILVLALIAYFVLQSFVKNETLGILVSGVYTPGACAIGIYLCRYKLANINDPILHEKSRQ